MGRQIVFHMLEEDRTEFFRMLSSRHSFVAASWTSSTPTVGLCESPGEEQVSLGLWQPRSDMERGRKRVEREDGSIAYDFDRRISVLEFDPSVIVTHSGTPALLQGRLYSFLNEMDAETSALFRTAKLWINRNFESSPLKMLGGYVGPAAMRWYREGGILLPMFNPPATPAWEEFIANQHGPLSASS